jgi:hypothetical protein
MYLVFATVPYSLQVPAEMYLIVNQTWYKRFVKALKLGNRQNAKPSDNINPKILPNQALANKAMFIF